MCCGSASALEQSPLTDWRCPGSPGAFVVTTLSYYSRHHHQVKGRGELAQSLSHGGLYTPQQCTCVTASPDHRFTSQWRTKWLDCRAGNLQGLKPIQMGRVVGAQPSRWSQHGTEKAPINQALWLPLLLLLPAHSLGWDFLIGSCRP